MNASLTNFSGLEELLSASEDRLHPGPALRPGRKSLITYADPDSTSGTDRTQSNPALRGLNAASINGHSFLGLLGPLDRGHDSTQLGP